MGGMSGSAIFAGLVSLTGSYSTAFTGLALLPAITGLILLTATRTAAPNAARD